MWKRFCPFPLCPTFRQFARLWSIIIIGIISWLILYAILGQTAAPGGHFFGMVLLIVASNFGGFLMSLTTLPRLIGMLITGILFQVFIVVCKIYANSIKENEIFQNLGWVDLGGELIEVTAYIRKFSLVLILIRAGLEMDPEAFKKVYITIVKLGLVPWTVECVLCAALAHYISGMPGDY